VINKLIVNGLRQTIFIVFTDTGYNRKSFLTFGYFLVYFFFFKKKKKKLPIFRSWIRCNFSWQKRTIKTEKTHKNPNTFGRK